MDFETHSRRLEYLLRKIKTRQLESPRQLEQYFECSERTIRNMINRLRQKGHDIKYCKRIRRYILQE